MKKIMAGLLSLFSAITPAENTIKELPENIKRHMEERLDLERYYPIFKPGDWIGIKHGAVYDTIIGTAESPELVIGFGIDTPENFIFLTKQDSDKLEIKDVKKIAYSNIDALSVDFVFSESLDSKVLTASGNALSSEAILSSHNMKKAHKLLNAKEILVSIPRRTMMMVISKDAPKDIFNKFVYLHKHAWEDESYGNPTITSKLFLLQDGEVMGVADLGF